MNECCLLRQNLLKNIRFGDLDNIATPGGGVIAFSAAEDFRNFQQCNFVIRAVDGPFSGEQLPQISAYISDNPDSSAEGANKLKICSSVDLTRLAGENPEFEQIAIGVCAEDVGTIVDCSEPRLSEQVRQNMHYLTIGIETQGEAEFSICCICSEPLQNFACEEHYNKFTGSLDGIGACPTCE